MSSADLLVLAAGLGLGWIAIAAYLVHLHLRAHELEDEVADLRARLDEGDPADDDPDEAPPAPVDDPEAGSP